MLYWIVYIVVEAIIQGFLIEKGNKPIYLVLFLIRGIFSILHGIVLDVQNIQEYAVLLGFQISSFWTIFDPLLNFVRNKPLNYKGKDSGWLDMLPYTWYYVLMGLSLIFAIVFYYMGLQYWIF